MQKKCLYTSLVIIPVVILLMSFSLRKSDGPYFYNNHYDPVYAYLVSSLNLSELKDVNFYLHPGTTVEIIGAVALKTYFFAMSDQKSIVEDVYSKPEAYLYAILAALILIHSISLFFIGLIIYKASHNIFLSALVQLSSTIFYTITYELSMVTSDNLLVPVTLYLVAVSLKFIYNSPPVKGKYTYEILFALICGFGLATKLTFLPMLLVPVILLTGIKRKLLFSGLSGIVFLIFIFPVYPHLPKMFVWIKNLFFHSGSYGSGDANFIDFGIFKNNLAIILESESYFLYSFLLILIFLFVSLFGNLRKRIITFTEPEYKLSISFFLAMLFTTVFAAKQYAPRYMIPALLLSPVSLYLVFLIVIKIARIKEKSLIQNATCLIMTGYIAINSYIKMIEAKTSKEERRNESAAFDGYIRDLDIDSKPILTCYGSSSLEYALSFTLPFSGSQNAYYSSLLKKKYPTDLFYEPWGGKKIHSISGVYDVKGILNSKGQMILKMQLIEGITSGTLEDIKNELIHTYNFKNPKFIKLFSNINNEIIYEVTLE